jgi:hypothetical protein
MATATFLCGILVFSTQLSGASAIAIDESDGHAEMKGNTEQADESCTSTHQEPLLKQVNNHKETHDELKDEQSSSATQTGVIAEMENEEQSATRTNTTGKQSICYRCFNHGNDYECWPTYKLVDKNGNVKKDFFYEDGQITIKDDYEQVDCADAYDKYVGLTKCKAHRGKACCRNKDWEQNCFSVDTSKIENSGEVSASHADLSTDAGSKGQ